MSTAWSRVTVLGETARANLVLPSDQPVGTLVGDLVSLLDEPAASSPGALVVTTTTGQVLAPDVSLLSAGVVDGAVLRLVRETDAPSPPVIGDVTEESVLDLGRRGGRWSPVARRIVLTVVAGVAAAVAVLLADLHAGHPAAVLGVAGAAGAVAFALGAVAGLLGRRWPSTVLTAVGCGAGGTALVLAIARSGAGVPVVVGAAGLAALVVIGTAGAVTWRNRGPLLGAVVGLGLGGAWLALAAGVLPLVEVLALVVAAAVVVCGLVPRWALTMSGLTALDDRRATGADVPRARLVRSLAAAHAGLSWALVAAVGIGTAAAVVLASRPGPWGVAVAGCAAVVFAVRARNHPLLVEVVVLAIGAVATTTAVLAVLASRLPHAWAGWTAAAALVVVVAVVAVSAPASASVTARVRRLADRAEAVAVLALVPCVIGAFGVFGRLATTFT